METDRPQEKNTSRSKGFSSDINQWRETIFSQEEKIINAIENELEQNNQKEDGNHEQEFIFKDLKRKLKSQLNSREIEIDEIALNAANSSKLQISVPSNLNYLMKVWAAAEGRDLASVALQCMEFGLREMKSKGTIPSMAVEKYQIACEKRILLAEINGRLDRRIKALALNLTE